MISGNLLDLLESTYRLHGDHDRELLAVGSAPPHWWEDKCSASSYLTG